MKTGISLYFSNGIEKNKEMIEKAIEHKVGYVFTSLHIPEETGIDYRTDIKELLELCKAGNLHMIVDVGPETLDKLGAKSIDDLEDTGISYIRLDYGFSSQETVRLSEKFHVVFNASTITEDEIKEWKIAGADFTRFTACHNYYPKQFSALSIQRVKEINFRLKILGFTTMAFVPGDSVLRGPIYEGLPTVEGHRNKKEEVALNMLELYMEGACDVVLVGDVDISQKNWHAIRCLSEDYVELQADLSSEYDFIKDIIHHDRPDSSEMIIRSQESRFYKQEILSQPVVADSDRIELIGEWQEDGRQTGSICISNNKYLRYMGELEIARLNLPGDERLNIIGEIIESDRKYLPYIRNGLGIKLL